MNKILLYHAITALVLVTICQSLSAQDNFLWPIKGQEAGDNILLRPGDLLDHEANYCDLIIGAKEGTEVIAPADGMITNHKRLAQRGQRQNKK